MRIAVKCYLFTLGVTGEFEEELPEGATLRQLCQQAKAQLGEIDVLEGIQANRVILLKNGDRIQSEDVVLHDGDRIMLIDANFGG